MREFRRQTRTHLALSLIAFGGAAPWLLLIHTSSGYAVCMYLMCASGGMVEFERSRRTWRRFRSCQRTQLKALEQYRTTIQQRTRGWPEEARVSRTN